jgi:hypothetical protein
LVDTDTEQEKRGVSVRSATTMVDRSAGLTATEGELWASIPGRSALT